MLVYGAAINQRATVVLKAIMQIFMHVPRSIYSNISVCFEVNQEIRWKKGRLWSDAEACWHTKHGGGVKMVKGRGLNADKELKTSK